MPEIDIKEVVRERYAEAARNVRAPGSCCGGDAARRWPAQRHHLQSLR